MSCIVPSFCLTGFVVGSCCFCKALVFELGSTWIWAVVMFCVTEMSSGSFGLFTVWFIKFILLICGVVGNVLSCFVIGSKIVFAVVFSIKRMFVSSV